MRGVGTDDPAAMPVLSQTIRRKAHRKDRCVPQRSQIRPLSCFLSLLDLGKHTKEVCRYSMKTGALLLDDGVDDRCWVEDRRGVNDGGAMHPCSKVP